MREMYGGPFDFVLLNQFNLNVLKVLGNTIWPGSLNPLEVNKLSSEPAARPLSKLQSSVSVQQLNTCIVLWDVQTQIGFGDVKFLQRRGIGVPFFTWLRQMGPEYYCGTWACDDADPLRMWTYDPPTTSHTQKQHPPFFRANPMIHPCAKAALLSTSALS